MGQPQKSVFRTIAEPLAIAVALAFAVRGAMRIYTIPSRSMLPTLQVGDRIVVTRYLLRDPRHGDVIVFRSPLDSNELLVKRVIALPGDLVDAQEGRVRIGTHTLSEPYLARPASSGAFTAQIVAGDTLFVMGDNRAESQDSRHWGPVRRELVVGRARVILWHDGDRANGSGRRIFKWVE